MTRRSVLSGTFAAAAVVPALVWLSPAFLARAIPSFRDQGDFFYPIKLYTADRIRAGELPLWNPLSGMGEPWLANLQSGVFYPPGMLFLIPSAAWAGGLFLLFHFTVAAWGARRFLKDEAVSDAGSLIGSALFAAGGFAASLCAYWNHFGGWAYLPAIASVARSGLRNRASRLGLAGLIALESLAGSPEMLAVSILLAVVFAAFARPEPEGWAHAPGGSRIARCGAALALGLAAAACALVPFAELALRSDRGASLAAAERDFGSVGLPALSSLLGWTARADATSYLATLFFGPAALFAAAAAFGETARRRLVLVLAAIALVGIVLAMGAPPGSWLRAVPPLDRVRYPAKALGMTVFAGSMLAGVGADALRFARLPVRNLWRALAAGGLLLILFSRQALLVRAAGAGALAALAVLTWPGEAGSRGRAALQSGAALLLIAALLLAGRPIFRFAPEAELRRIPESVVFLTRVPGRVLTPPMRDLAAWVLRDARFDSETLRRQREALLGYTSLLEEVRTIRTAAPLATVDAAMVSDAIDGSKDLQAVAGAVSGRVLWTPNLPPRMGSRKVGQFFRAPINPYRPRLAVVRSYEMEPDSERARRRVLSGESDWSRRVLLDRAPDPSPGSAESRGFVLARLAEDRPERVVADVTTGSPALAVLADLHYPGWIAELDGKRTVLLRADGFFRAVAVPAGSHRIVFRYRPFSVLAGGAISAAALIVLASLAMAGEPRRHGALL